MRMKKIMTAIMCAFLFVLGGLFLSKVSEAADTQLFTSEFGGASGFAGSYTADQTVTVDGRSYFFSYGYKSGTDVRLGHNKVTTLPAKYNPTGNASADGAAVELQFNIENASSISFTTGATYGTFSNWYILFSTDEFATFEVLSSGTSAPANQELTASLATPKTGRFALAIAGAKPRLQLVTVTVYTGEVETASPIEEAIANVNVSSSLVVDYEANVAKNADLRFGGVISADLYNADYIYGVILFQGEVTLTSGIVDETEMAFANEYGVKVVCTPAEVEGGYQFAAVITDTEGCWAEKVTAAIFVVDDEGNTYITAGRTESIETLAAKYVEQATELALSADIVAVLSSIYED